MVTFHTQSLFSLSEPGLRVCVVIIPFRRPAQSLCFPISLCHVTGEAPRSGSRDSPDPLRSQAGRDGCQARSHSALCGHTWHFSSRVLWDGVWEGWGGLGTWQDGRLNGEIMHAHSARSCRGGNGDRLPDSLRKQQLPLSPHPSTESPRVATRLTSSVPTLAPEALV